MAKTELTNNLVPVTQKPGQPWTDEQGISIPFTRVNKSEKLKERLAASLVKESMVVSAKLKALHDQIRLAENAIYEASKAEGKTLTKKGSFTWYNFDKSIRIEVNNNDTVKFDEAMIAAARERLDEFIKDNTSGTDDIVRQLINSAFHSGKGGLDTKKVLGLLKWRSKIKDGRFQEALNLISESQNIDSSKKYYRVWVKDEQGQYQNINLQFSNI
jgi:hypothetical protein